MKKSYKLDFEDDESRKHKKSEKGRNKVDKYKKRVYNMATSLNPDDEAFDEYLDYEEAMYRRFKLK
jgi:hypothetical protein